MPMPNFHACRMRDPGDFQDGSFRVVKQGNVQIVIGKLQGKTTTTAQSIRYPLSDWTEQEARRACKKRGGILFEPASEAKESHSIPELEITLSQSELDKILSGGEVELLDDPSKAPDESGKQQFALETKTLKDVPIFAAGTWTSSEGNKTKWTEAMLDQIVANAKKLSKRVIPFLRVSHTDDKTQKRITGRFKIGDLENIRRVGKRLIADFVRVPKKAYGLMEAGVFGRPSAEIWRKFRDEATGSVIDNVLAGAVVLSAEHPAVTTLDDIRSLFGAEPTPGYEIVSFESEQEPPICFMTLEDEPPEGGDDVTKEEVTAMIEEAKEKWNSEAFSKINEALGIEDGADAVKAIEDLKSGKAQLETEAAEREKAEFKSQVDALLLEATKACKVTPALEPTLRESFSGKSIDEIRVALDGLPAIPGLKFAESGSEADPADKGGEAAMGDTVPEDVLRYSEEHGVEIDGKSAETNEKVLEVMKKHRLSYGEAFREVTGEHIDITPNEGADVEED